MVRVAGCDPGTSSLDVLVLDDGAVADQVRFEPDQLRGDPAAAVKWLRDRGPFDLIAGPSGYGLPLVRAENCTDQQLELMSLVRPDERGSAKGVGGFGAVARAFRDGGLPVVFLPGVIHLPTVPAYRKLNKIDMGTPDKLCVAALAALHGGEDTLAVVELGSAFTAVIQVCDGQIEDGLGGTAGAMGGRGGGAWDGEVAYLLSPLRKADLFAGGLADAPADLGKMAYIESVTRAVFGLPRRIDRVVLSGRMLDDHPGLLVSFHDYLDAYPQVRLASLPDAWVKHAAQGAAVIADGLAGGRFAPVVERLRLREAAGTVLDWLTHPRADEVRRAFGVLGGQGAQGAHFLREGE